VGARLALALLLGMALQVQAAPEAEAEAPAQGMFSRLSGQVGNQWQLTRQTLGEQSDRLLEQAMTMLGVPYKRGGSSEAQGFDCSGFVRAMYEQTVGLVLPRRAREQAAATEAIDRKELRPGDLVFFNTMRQTFSHVGIYLGDNKFIHAPRAGQSVRVDDMRDAYWKRRFTGARRVEGADAK
jgi:cell wall-associated NlpC family hydrolase